MRGLVRALSCSTRQRSRAAVRLAIEKVLDELPERYAESVGNEKCDTVYQHFYEAYMGQGRGVYAVM